MEYPIRTPKSLIRSWNKSAMDCYARGGVCEGCEYKALSTHCKMKETVIELVKKLGRPRGVVTQQIKE